jgi:hypothetical protein
MPTRSSSRIETNTTAASVKNIVIGLVIISSVREGSTTQVGRAMGVARCRDDTRRLPCLPPHQETLAKIRSIIELASDRDDASAPSENSPLVM